MQRMNDNNWATSMILILLVWCLLQTVWNFLQAHEIVVLRRSISTLQILQINP